MSVESESGITIPESSKDTPMPFMRARAMDMMQLQIEFSDEKGIQNSTLFSTFKLPVLLS
jgi:hypothetical protein